MLATIEHPHVQSLLTNKFYRRLGSFFEQQLAGGFPGLSVEQTELVGGEGGEAVQKGFNGSHYNISCE